MPLLRKQEDNLAKLAKNMFEPADKEPYYQGGRAIKNFQELMDNLDSFSEGEAGWIASWIEYLGDNQTAEKIKNSSGDFKGILQKRYSQLRKYR